MNPKEIKAIAEIIRKKKQHYSTCLQGSIKVAVNISIENIIDDLADYFDKENYIKKDGSFVYKFNKKQFLKDCGVKE